MLCTCTMLLVPMAETASIQQYLYYTFLCVLVVSILIKLKLRSPHTKHHGGSSCLNLPPGPWKLPVIGNMHSLLLGALPHQAMHSLARRHGPVMLLRLGHVPTLVLSSPEAARQTLKVHGAAFASRPIHATADIITYGGEDIAFARHDSRHWKAARKLCTMELLSPRRVRSFRPVREEEAARMVRSIKATSALGPVVVVNVSERVKVMLNDMIMRVSVGDRCPQQEAFLEELDRLLNVMSGFNLIDLFPTSRLARVLGAGSVRAAWETRGRMQSILDVIIQDHDHERAMRRNEEAPTVVNGTEEDILSTLLRFQRDGGMGLGGITLTNENVYSILLDVFTAGSETAGTTTVWAMSELMRSPRVMAIAQSQVRRVLGGKTMVTEADIDGQLPYLQMVIKETFRLHPPLPFLLPRLCGETTKIMGYDVLPGTTVLVNTWAIGRDEASWSVDATEFKPERFEAGNKQVDYGGTDFRFLPGGAGLRMCPGMNFGVSSIEIALASLLYHFDWKVPGNKELDMAEALGITIRRRTSLLLEATPFVP